MAGPGQRPPRSAGRPKGAKNKVTARREAEIAASGLTPLQYMLSVMRDPKNTQEQRLDAARAVAPYVHPKLASMVLQGDPEKPVRIETIERRIVKADHRHS